jgi:hypothetical protein
MPFIIIFILAFSLPTTVSAAPNIENLYINPQRQNRSEAIIFYNSANPCETCRQAVNMLIAVLEANYRHTLHAYLINEQTHPSFIPAFRLNAPVSLVIVRISDGAAFGYEKLDGLQSLTSSPELFNRRVKEFINNFLGF